MFTDEVLDALKRKQITGKPDAQLSRAIEKIRKNKRLSTCELFKVYDALWKEGPKVKYESPDTRRKPEEGRLT